MNNLNNGKIDRRRHVRLIQDIPLTVKVPGVQDCEEAYSKNLSEGGLFLEDAVQADSLSRIDIPKPGEKIELFITLPNRTDIKAMAEIIWARQQQAPFKKKLAIGVKFINLNEIDRFRLSKYIMDEIKPQRKNFVFEKIIYLSDTNAEGNVYFTRYFDWQGQAREEFYRQHFPLSVWQKGIKLITVNASTEYKHECFLFDEIAITVEVANLKNMSLEIIFTYHNKKTNQTVAFGKEKIAFANPQGKLIPIPEEIVKNARYFLTEEDSAEKSA